MGKIRIKTIGDEEAEKKQQEEMRKRAEAKRAEQRTEEKPAITEHTDKAAEALKKIELTKKLSDSADNSMSSGATRSKYAAKTAKPKHSKKYQDVIQKIDKSKIYSLAEALTLLPQLTLTKFDETVELHINTTDKGISGNVVLPHGTGKKIRIIIVDQSDDSQGIESLVKEVEAGKINFDVLLATPDSMPRLARIAKYLGPRGLMPNPKNGTVSQNPKEAAKKYESGQINFKTEAKFPIIHMAVGKLSFGKEKLRENIKEAVQAVNVNNIKNITLKSTMSPGIKISHELI